MQNFKVYNCTLTEAWNQDPSMIRMLRMDNKSDRERFIESSRLFRNVEKLDLRNMDIDDDFIEELCDSDSLPRLSYIDLRGNPRITIKSLEYILDSQIMGSVRFGVSFHRKGNPQSSIDVNCCNTGVKAKDVKTFTNERYPFTYYIQDTNGKKLAPTADCAIKVLNLEYDYEE